MSSPEEATKREDRPGEDDDDSIGNGDVESSHASETKTHTDSETEKSIQEALAKQESAAVFRLRAILIVIKIIVAIAVALTIYRVTAAGQHSTFNTEYEGVSEKITDAFSSIVNEMAAVSGLGVALTAHSVDTSKDWPFLTLTNFQERAANARILSGALYISICPRVEFDQFDKWENYVNSSANSWIDQGHAYQQQLGIDDFEYEPNVERSRLTNRTVDPMHYFVDGVPHAVDRKEDYYMPLWQTSPVLKTSYVNENRLDRANYSIPQTAVAEIVLTKASALLGGFTYSHAGSVRDSTPRTAFLAALLSVAEGQEVEYQGDPMAGLYMPIFDAFNQTTRQAEALMEAVVHWKSYFRNILPSNIKGITVVLDNSCDGFFTYEINGKEAVVVGFGDHHDPAFNKYEKVGQFKSFVLQDGTVTGIPLHHQGCHYKIHVYPSQKFYDAYNTNMPLIITFSIVAVFVFKTCIFITYDILVERRQKVVMAKATQSTAIVSSLFPKSVTDRLMEVEGMGLANKTRLKGFLNGEGQENEAGANPIADLFPNCTVFFCDISGFTAWSSTREPAQVFILLQSVYQAFDILAKRRKVFKVETIGDSYMAVTGLPEPQDNHATNMVRFAWECLIKMREVTKDLECSLGPDTSDLEIRVGLNSGPVTAGVLRGDRARFQLFGDTVNTASRMESTGIRGKVQISQTTAQLLRDAGKEHWLKPREDLVTAKGKGVMNTFWVNPSSKKGSSVNSASESSDRRSSEGVGSVDRAFIAVPEKKINTRLVNWMCDLLMDDAKKVILARRNAKVKESSSSVSYIPPKGKTCMDEVLDVIQMPDFDAEGATCSSDTSKIEINEAVKQGLNDYVTIIASMYRNNPFHNFEHACHVTMSVKKLLKRIVAPDLTEEQLEALKSKDKSDLASHLHDYTHGINSDPLTSLAVTFSAMIHDVDHRGVSNMQLMVEEPKMAEMYHNKSIAEQNSLDLAWNVLMQDRFAELRRTLFGDEATLLRFRQLIVNVVLATDIFDKELNDLRKSRWEKAFTASGEQAIDSDLRATIVIEHIIQASDVSHTMQHWHIYQKWNKQLFTELYLAWKAGRMGKDPSTFWYKGEMGFFDNYIIPLANKLKECGVFGVSSHEYLNYALQNRAEWEERGEELVENLVRSIAAKEEKANKEEKADKEANVETA